jgi:putative peptide zinc metalloprotease protein
MNAVGGEATLPEEDVFRFVEEAPIPPLRGDLKVVALSMRGRRTYVVKDPAALKYFRWGEREYHLASLLDGRRTAGALLEEVQGAFPSTPFNEEDLRKMINQFLGAGLLQTDGRVARLLYLNTRDQTKKAIRRKSWLTVPGKIIMFRIPLFDPDLLLLRLNRHLGFMWRWPAAFVLLSMLLGAGWLVASDAANLATRMPDLFGWQNLVIMWFVLIAVKVVHEFGHGLACKHFGGEVHEMGAIFIVFSPFLFCNASDSWTLSEKWKRLVVTFGGIYFELFLAAVGAVLWVLTPPGLFNQIAFNVMIVCSIVTIFFNANPLMKFDGYYALSDFLEMPNLKERGDRTLVSRSAGVFTGGAGVIRDPMADTMKWTIITYAVASYAWTIFVAYNILQIIGVLLEPAGLDRLAQSTAAVTLLAGILAPPIMIGLHILKTARADDSGQVRRRALISGMIAAFLLAVVFSIPASINVRSACVIDADNRARVTAATAGFIREVSVQDGQQVARGEVLARLENPPLEVELESLRHRLSAIRLEESTVIHEGTAAGASEARSVRRQFEAAEAKAATDVAALELIAPVSGVVIGRDLREKAGTLLRRGDLFCEILPEGPMQALVALNEDDAGLVQAGQKVVFKLRSLPDRTFRGEVLSVDVAPARELPHQSLGEQAGGTVPSVLVPDTNPDSSRAIPAHAIYQARVAVDNFDGVLRPGMSGRIKIECGTKPFGQALWRKVTTMIRTDFRL